MSKPGSPILVLGATGRTGRRAQPALDWDQPDTWRAAAASGAWTPR
jgi:hypothetical protein